ncbi:hypothetical protein [Candidatus Burkholderia verschuerenii]|uniref:hypothetical protein n=1 Tax=Candidatus Burkholderia verschuerenii TaxID=242163 RepID=UPI0018DDF9CF|nr:hypothetical protein [Candidatus Burkholderia verschuerenii]
MQTRPETRDAVEHALLAGVNGIGGNGVDAMRDQPVDETGESFVIIAMAIGGY